MLNTNNTSVQSAPESYNVNALVNRYLNATQSKSVFSNGFGLLAEAYLWAMGDDYDERVRDIMEQFEFQDGILTDEELTFLGKHLIELIDIILASHSYSHDGVSTSMLPAEVVAFMCSVAEFPEDVVVYNPFSGTASFAANLPNDVEGEEIFDVEWALGEIRLAGTSKLPLSLIRQGDSFETMANNKKYKAIISAPAYLKEKGKSIETIVEMLYDKLDDGGKLVCLVPTFMLNNMSAERLRTRLIKDKALKGVALLPNNIFIGTAVPQAVIIVTKGLQNDYVILADASGYTRFEKSVYKATKFQYERFLKDLEDEVDDYFDRGGIIDNSSIGAPIQYSMINSANLSPIPYLTSKPKNGVALSSLATKVIGRTKHDETANYFIIGSSIPATMHRKSFVPSTVNDGKVSSAKAHVELTGSNVIVGLVNGKVRTAYTEKLNGIMAFPSDFVMVLKPNEGVSAKYLAAVLSTPEVSSQITANAIGSVIPRMRRVDLSDIIVPNHDTPESREQLIAEVISSEMSDLETELQNAFENHKREVRSTRHAMIQTLSALSSNWEQLNLFSQLNGGTLKMSDTIGRINPITLETLMVSIAHSIKTLQNQVESLRYERADWGKEVEINPVEFINTFIETHSCPEVKMEVVERNNSADIPWIDEETGETQMLHTDSLDVFYAPKRLVERIFNNIVSNAKAHGFANKEGGHIIRFHWEMEGNYLVIRIANNGAPLKVGVSENDVLMNGFSTSLNMECEDGTFHSGHGGFEIKSLMEGLGSVEVISLPDDEFPVIYKLTFEKTNTVALY